MNYAEALQADAEDFGPGRTLHKGVLIELASAENDYPAKGWFYVPALWRSGDKTGFASIAEAKRVIDALVAFAGQEIRRCRCGAIIVSSAADASRRVGKHRGRCGQEIVRIRLSA
jgi:hypothetical protein